MAAVTDARRDSLADREALVAHDADTLIQGRRDFLFDIDQALAAYKG